MKKRKWTWKASRRSIINISILLASFIIIILILVLGIRGIVRSAKASSESKKILAKVKDQIESFQEKGNTGFSSYIVKQCAKAIPSGLMELSWVQDHKDLYTSAQLKECKKNQDLVHFLYLLGNQFYVTDQPITFTPEETAAVPPYFKQWDDRWGFDAYGETMIGLSGSGPTCLAMVVSGLSDTMISPRDAASFAEEYGYVTAEGDTFWGIIPGGCDYYDLSCYELILDENAMKQALDSGGIIVAVVGSGTFSSEGEFLVIHSYNESGFMVYDPNNTANSKTAWAFDAISSQIQALYQIF